MKLDMHVHSCASYDCQNTLSDIVKQSLASGLDGIAVCDHDIPLTAKVIERETEALENKYNIIINPQTDNYTKKPFFIIRGIEISTSAGHILGLFLKKDLPMSDSPIEYIKSCGGVAILAHPFQRRESDEDFCHLPLDGAEAFNSRAAYKNSFANLMAKEYCEKKGIIPSAGSDAHLLCEIGRAYIEMDLVMPTLSQIETAFKNRRHMVCGKCSPATVIAKSQLIKSKKAKNPLKFIKASLLYIKLALRGNKK